MYKEAKALGRANPVIKRLAGPGGVTVRRLN
jgi:hypothetical protein